MIIYGSKNKQIAKEHLMDKCPHCGTQNSIDMYVFQKYAHVFWIPLFPMGKTAVSQCDHCMQVLKPDEMPSSLKTVFQNITAQSKTPIWTFSGLAIIAGLIILGVISDKQNDEKNLQLIQAPQSGDIFKVKTKDKQYTLYKISQVLGDSVFIQLSTFETNKLSGLNNSKMNEFTEDLFGFSKTELKNMLDNGEIIDIERK